MSMIRTWLPVVICVVAGGYYLFVQEQSGEDDVRVYRGGVSPSEQGPESDRGMRLYRGRNLQAESSPGVVAMFRLCKGSNRKNCVVDGDTIWYGGMKIRISDIDTPEISRPKCEAEGALGHRAKNRLLELLNTGPFEVIQVGSRDKDRYGRKLRVIIRDGQSLGSILIAEGLARRWDGARRSWCQ
jgi:endonuclease YncB( thermonuclease family)